MLWTSQTGWRGGEEEHREKRQRNTGRLFQWSVLLEENIGRRRRMISRSRIAAQVAFSEDRAADTLRILSEDASQVVTTWIWSFNVSV